MCDHGSSWVAPARQPCFGTSEWRAAQVMERGRVAVSTAVRSGLRRTWVQVVTVLVFFVAVWAFLAAFAERHGFFDLRVYYGAVNFWVSGGGQVYDYLLPQTEYGFTYPPFAAVIMTPMAF